MRKNNKFLTKKLVFLLLLFALSSFLYEKTSNININKYKEYEIKSENSFYFPTEGLITAICKPGSHENNGAVDISNIKKTPIYAAMEGKVIFCNDKDGYGKCIFIDHNNNYSTVYAHLCQFNVTEGQWVAKGENIGFMGSSGNSTGPHLHFEIRLNNNRENILKYFPYLEINLYIVRKNISN
ncbi:MAG: M23 family metallopeptidase [Eubacteriaceae bacterium]